MAQPQRTIKRKFCERDVYGVFPPSFFSFNKPFSHVSAPHTSSPGAHHSTSPRCQFLALCFSNGTFGVAMVAPALL